MILDKIERATDMLNEIAEEIIRIKKHPQSSERNTIINNYYGETTGNSKKNAIDCPAYFLLYNLSKFLIKNKNFESILLIRALNMDNDIFSTLKNCSEDLVDNYRYKANKFLELRNVKTVLKYCSERVNQKVNNCILKDLRELPCFIKPGI
jgi:hypothetical protein